MGGRFLFSRNRSADNNKIERVISTLCDCHERYAIVLASIPNGACTVKARFVLGCTRRWGMAHVSRCGVFLSVSL